MGPGVTRFSVGDAVFGMPWFPRQAGGYAEFVTAPSRQFAHRPAGLSEIEAGALSLAGLTAWQCLVDIADVKPGQRVLIHAAAGGVGHLAVQIAKARGAHVIGTASVGKHTLLHDLGADEAVDYRSERFERVIEPVDLVLDLIGGEVALRSLDVLVPDGRLICLPSAAAAEAVNAAADRGIRATGMLAEPDGAGLVHLAELVDDRRLRVLVAETFPLERASHAHRAGEFGHGLGHGVGLEIHEAPALSPLGAGTLADRMAVTVEPGVYLAGRGGVRIEDTLVVREGAEPELLTLSSKDLTVL